ncbi:MAG: MotA/TolQ/ExbB proton channel family protein [Candidatus Manganitrophaceae bacterium]
MLELYLKGGFWMHPILAASVVALAVALERGWYFWQIRGEIPALFQALSDSLSKGDPDGAVEAAGKIVGPVGVVLKEGLKHQEEGPEIVQEVMAIRGEEVLRSAQRGIPVLALIASISTMLGLLGTVVGLVEAFQKVAEMESRVSPALLASGIWAALVTTVGGLFVAIPTLILHHYFQEKVAHLTFQIEHYGNEMLLLFRRGTGMTGQSIRSRSLPQYAPTGETGE